MKVVVGHEEIIRGEAGNPFCCPIALAINKIVRTNVAVTIMGVRDRFKVVKPYEDFKYYALPIIARIFMDNFDNGVPVDPFQFEMEDMEIVR
jgi:hypothetical protein